MSRSVVDSLIQFFVGRTTLRGNLQGILWASFCNTSISRIQTPDNSVKEAISRGICIALRSSPELEGLLLEWER